MIGLKNGSVILVLLSLILTLTACGFKLRSQAGFPPQMQTLYLNAEDPYGLFETSLRQTLQASGVKLTDSPAAAPVTLNLPRTVLDTDNTTFGGSNEARVFDVTYRVAYSLTDSNGRVIVPMTEIVTSRSLILNANQLLTSNDQLMMLSQEMQRETISKMRDRLSSRQVREALTGTSQATEKYDDPANGPAEID